MMTNLFSGAAAVPDDFRLFSLSNSDGMAVTISERGAALRSWHAPDRYGRMANVVLPHADGASPAVPAARWHGAHIGGGVSLLHAAAGGVERMVRYRFGDEGSLVINYQAMAASPTPLKLGLDPYFNLDGGNAEVDDHILLIDADFFVELDAGGMPAGVAAVEGTAFDFRQPAPIGPRLRWHDTQIRLAGGFEHCFFVRGHFAGGQGALREVARVFDPRSGRRPQMYTTEAALHFRTGGCGGIGLDARAIPGLRSADWPQFILQPGQLYRQTTVYRVSLQT